MREALVRVDVDAIFDYRPSEQKPSGNALSLPLAIAANVLMAADAL